MAFVASQWILTALGAHRGRRYHDFVFDMSTNTKESLSVMYGKGFTYGRSIPLSKRGTVLRRWDASVPWPSAGPWPCAYVKLSATNQPWPSGNLVPKPPPIMVCSTASPAVAPGS